MLNDHKIIGSMNPEQWNDVCTLINLPGKITSYWVSVDGY